MLLMMEKVWSRPSALLITELKTNSNLGLTGSDAAKRLRKGANELTSHVQLNGLSILLRQFQSPLVFLLFLAAGLSVYQGEPRDSIAILIVLFGNAAIGFFQEYKAEATISKLKHLLSPKATVLRDGAELKIPARQLVVGDILLIEAGDRVQADGRIIESSNLRINEANLTGESVPAHKNPGLSNDGQHLTNRRNMAYMSTLVVDGRAKVLVTSTGNLTELGKIASEISQMKPQPTILQRKTAALGRLLLIVSVVSVIAVAVVGLVRGIEFALIFRIALSLFVSVVPEGLPIVLTFVLSIGLIRLYRRHVLIRQLGAAETLGSATIICVDKTGTLTEGDMMVEKIVFGETEATVTGQGFSLSGDFIINKKKADIKSFPALGTILELSSLTTTAKLSQKELKDDEARQIHDPTETALTVVSAKAGYYAYAEERRFPEVSDLPFDQELRYSASVHKLEKVNRCIVKGSPETILDMSSYIISSNGARRRLLRATHSVWHDRAASLASQGYRVIALAYTDTPKSAAPNLKKLTGMSFLGFFCLVDPIRPDVKDAIRVANQAGVRVMIITGDHLLTATNVADRLGLKGQVIDASELGRANLKEVSVIARATPTNKLVIVQKLQKSGEIVAMTGDGVNDAPALKQADLGIAMGKSGTDVAIEASSMVLLKDNFRSIVEAINQGRLIWENLIKVIYYLVSTSFAELLTVLVVLIVGLPLPLSAIQILWMNLVTDGVMSLSLATEDRESSPLAAKPRSREENLVSRSMGRRMVMASIVMTAGSLLTYFSFIHRGQLYAQSAVLTVMVFFQIFNAFNARSSTQSAFSVPLSRNTLLAPLVVISVILQLAILYLPLFQRLLHTEALDGLTLITVIAIASSIVLADELRKLTRSWLLAWSKLQGETVTNDYTNS